MSARKTVFLDRDGVINKRVPDHWIRSLDEFHLHSGVPEAIARLNRAGFRTVVITNQRGLAIDRLTWSELETLHQHLEACVSKAGGDLREFYVCPHDRHEGCPCRKPEPGLLDGADAREPVLWSQSFLIGDRESDIGAGRRRDVTTIKIADAAKSSADYLVADLTQAVELILGLHPD